MSKIKLLSIGIIGLLLANLVLIAFLFFRKAPVPRGGRPPMTQEGPKRIIIERLHFDSDQIVQYEALIKAHQSSVKSLNDSIKIAKNNLYQSLTTEDFEGKDSLIAKLGLLQRKIELTHYDHFAALKNICKPDQIENYKRLTKELARFFAPDKKERRPPKE